MKQNHRITVTASLLKSSAMRSGYIIDLTSAFAMQVEDDEGVEGRGVRGEVERCGIHQLVKNEDLMGLGDRKIATNPTIRYFFNFLRIRLIGYAPQVKNIILSFN